MPLFSSRPVESPAVIEADPAAFPKIDGANLAAAFLGERVAGDFYDSVRVSPERVLFGLLDVAGRREQNRDLLASAQQIFRGLGAELFSRADLNESDAMTELCLRINRRLLEVASGVHPCPAFIACYHEKFGTLCYTNAGHTPGLLRDSAGVSEIKSTGLPLGLFSHATCDSPTIGLEPGAALLLVSRGVVECDRHDNNCTVEFSLERVKDLLQTAAATSAESLCRSVLNAVDEFSARSAPRDDRTALAFLRMA